MTDEDRRHPANGVWLCRQCAKKIDADKSRYPSELLHQWRADHEAWVDAGCPSERQPLREVEVTQGGVGSVVVNEASGTGMKVLPAPGQAGERIRVVGEGVGEITVNTGSGIGKEIRASGATASQTTVVVDRPVETVAALGATIAFVTCQSCQTQFPVKKLVQGFAGDHEPKVEVKCQACGKAHWV